jgi:hypothetical protein
VLHTVIHNTTTVVHAHATDAMMKWGRGIFTKKIFKKYFIGLLPGTAGGISVIYQWSS